MRLAEPGWLILLLLVPLPWLWERARPRVAWPSFGGFAGVRQTWAGRLRGLPAVLRGLAIACLAVALARPQTVGGRTRIAGKGVAIIAAIDHSSSMNAEDFPSEAGTISRLEAAKQTFARFVVGREDDLIGLVVFANYPDLKCPPTLDHEFLLEAVRDVKTAPRGDDGTNLGDAIAWSLDALRSTSPKKKVLILLTDGRNSPAVPNPLPPEVAAALARDLGITLHTIAIGQAEGIVRRTEPITGLPLVRQVEGPDLPLLARLAEIGRGRSFVAADATSLDKVFRTINELEKSPVRGTIVTRYHEWYGPWVALALSLILLDRLLASGRFRRLP